jgi:hypothetical protein
MQLTTLRFAAGRSIEKSIRANSVGYFRTVGSVRVDHELLRNVILGAEAGLEWRDYEQPEQTATDGTIEASLRWLINRNLALIGSYRYTNRFQTSGGINDDDRNLVQLRLRVAL